MALQVVTGEENADQEVTVPVPGRASPLRLRFQPLASGSSQPLSTVIFADEQTVVPVPDQNGAIDTPFGSGQNAIDACPSGGTIMMTPGIYAGLSITGSVLQFIGMANRPSNGSVTVDITVGANLTARFESMVVAFTAVDGANLHFFNCQASGAFVADGTLTARLSRVEDVTGPPLSLNADDCDLGTIAAQNAILDGCTFAGDVTVTNTLVIRNAKSFGAVVLNATTIDIDTESFRRAVFAGVVFNGVVTGFGGGTLWWGKNSGITVGVFVPPGAGKQNYTGMSTSEANTQIIAPRRGVLCFLSADSNTTLKFTVRVGGADTLLSVICTGGTQQDTTHFVDVPKDALIGVAAQNGGDPIASGSAQVSAVFV